MSAPSSYILVMTLGPVQPFIAAARRSRDLHMGSLLLSEASKAAALHLSKPNVELIFPSTERGQASEQLALLDPEAHPPSSALNVANRIVALVRGDVGAVKALAGGARSAAEAQFRRFADKAWEVAAERGLNAGEAAEAKALEIDPRGAAFQAQLENALECYSAWAPYEPDAPEGPYGDYKKQLRLADRLMSGRKNLRDFAVGHSELFVPKSSLDGRADSVIMRPRRGQKEKAKDLERRQHCRIGPAEALDALGLTKRLGGEGYLTKPTASLGDEVAEESDTAPTFVALSRLALDPWIDGLGTEALTPLREICEQNRRTLRPYQSPIKELGETKRFSTFPFDGEVLLEGQLEAMIKEAKEAETGLTGDLGQAEKASELLEDFILPMQQDLYRKAGVPWPYVAILAADGDGIGAALSGLTDMGSHQRFSQLLAKFAGDARGIVEEQRGSLVYCGGDDVLAFLPVDLAIGCARQLHDTFEETMKVLVEEGILRKAPTLSAGIAIGHVLTPMGDLLVAARDLEELAKEGDLLIKAAHAKKRNALAIGLLPRSGAPTLFRQNWDEKPDQALIEMARWLEFEELPDRAAFTLLGLKREFELLFTASSPGALPADALRVEATRLLARKRGDRGATPVDRSFVDLLGERLAGARDPQVALARLEQLTHQLLIARMIERVSAQRRRKNQEVRR